jgi:hypothetical protein
MARNVEAVLQGIFSSSQLLLPLMIVVSGCAQNTWVKLGRREKFQSTVSGGAL